MADQLGFIGLSLFWDIVFKGEIVEEKLEIKSYDKNLYC